MFAALLSPSRTHAVAEGDRPAVFDVLDAVFVVEAPGPRLAGRVAERFARAVGGADVSASRLVIDLGGVSSVDAVGLRVLAGVARDFRERGCEVAFSAAARSVRRLLAAAGLHDLAEVYQTREQAVAALQYD